MAELKISTTPDNRTLKQILDSINEVAVRLDYLDCRNIQEDISEIWERYCDVPQTLTALPDLCKAVEILVKHYLKGKQRKYVRNPLAWALYQTWKLYDNDMETV